MEAPSRPQRKGITTEVNVEVEQSSLQRPPTYIIPASAAGGKTPPTPATAKQANRGEARAAKRDHRLAKSEARATAKSERAAVPANVVPLAAPSVAAVPDAPAHDLMASVDPELQKRYSLMMMQITAAHRVIGKLNLERDILAHHLEGLKASLPPGAVPETIHAVNPHAVHAAEGASSQPRAMRAMQDFFYGGTLEDVRRHRLSVLGVLLAIGMTTWVGMRMGLVVLPDKISRDRLGDLPYIGNSIGYAMAIWSFFRVFRIAGRGARWAYPNSMPRRRR